jgi:hypothetical protein
MEPKSEVDNTSFVTERMMREYEVMRASGVTAMNDYYRVVRLARKHKFSELAKLSQSQYLLVVKNYQALMKKFGIETLYRVKRGGRK